MDAFYNMVLRVNLSQESYEMSLLPDEILKKTLGGKGLATHLLLKYNPPGVDPLHEENHLIFAIGPVTGSAVWGSCRHGTFTKSPQTGFYSESYSGGKAAESIAACGFDAIMIHGASPKPLCLKGTTGLDLDIDNMRAIAASISDDTRRFNLQEGLTPEDDLLPPRFHKEPLPETGKVITEKQMAKLISDYYQVRGWTKKGEPQG